MNFLSVNSTEGAGFMRSAFKRLIFTQRVYLFLTASQTDLTCAFGLR